MLAIIDYGVGNIQSVINAFEHITDEIVVTGDEKIIKDASHIVLPGVGAFGKCMENLENSGLIPLIFREIEKGKPIMGICLGMQLLLTQSEEMGFFKGLDIIKGNVVKFKDGVDKIPQIGWNNIHIKKPTLFENVPDKSMFYFVHSYYVKPENDKVVACETEYNGIKYCSAIEYENIFATQFHPEKSGDIGLNVLRNFLKVK